MLQQQTGKFIAECRKQKGFTQAQLAEKLGITNRAVSKWETGNSIPDASLMLELCEILGITANELLCGGKLDIEQQKTQGEKNAIDLMFAKKELHNIRFCAAVLVFVGLLMTISFTSLMAQTVFEKIMTFSIGAFAWGCGVWLKVKVEKVLLKVK